MDAIKKQVDRARLAVSNLETAWEAQLASRTDVAESMQTKAALDAARLKLHKAEKRAREAGVRA